MKGRKIVVDLPCKIGDTVYKICPKCNDLHNGSCEHCAWRGCCVTGCDVGVRVYADGSHNNKELQIVPYKANENNFITILKLWNIMYFKTIEDTKVAMLEYNEIRNIEDRAERYMTYNRWNDNRKFSYSFLVE